MLKVRNGGGKEIPLNQGKEQWLCFAGAAVKRYPMPEGRQPRRVTPRPRPGATARRSHPMPEARSSSREEQPHVQGTVARGAIPH